MGLRQGTMEMSMQESLPHTGRRRKKGRNVGNINDLSREGLGPHIDENYGIETYKCSVTPVAVIRCIRTYKVPETNVYFSTPFFLLILV